MEAGPTDDASHRSPEGGPASPGAAAPGGGRECRDFSAMLAEFAAARAGLARCEAQDLARRAGRKGMTAAVALAALAFAWALLLAGGLGWAAAAGLPWHWIAIGAGVLHLLAVLVLGMFLARPAPPAFPLTRRELEKDREWIEKLKQDLKSHG